MYKKIIPFLNCENEPSKSIINAGIRYDHLGADQLFLYDYSFDEVSKTDFLNTVRELIKEIDIPMIIGLYIERLEDIKKALYTGARNIVIKNSLCKNIDLIKEGADRFGYDKIILEIEDYKEIYDKKFVMNMKETGVSAFLLKHIELSKEFIQVVENLAIPVIIRDSLKKNDLYDLIQYNNIIGISTNFFYDKEILKAKLALEEKDIPINTFKSKVSFKELKTNEDGLIPVVVQDYKSGQVLMLAYMNEEGYKQTVETGKMTYYSRSRKSLWIKGETSGHYQYLKSLYMDCDKDTILAKVSQVGAACHTGNYSCFYRELIKKDAQKPNSYEVLNQVYKTIVDRKDNPKEGSYTNYLFKEGIDKILKKCGEEATEIIIAAKNPNLEELKYEIADFLYHLMVLMVECDLDWDDIMTELSRRR